MINFLMQLKMNSEFTMNFDRWISLIGLFISIGGFLLAIIPIFKIKSRANEIAKAVKNSKDDISNLTIFAEINKHSQFINEIEIYVRDEKYSEALITCKDLKEKLNVLSGYLKRKEHYREEFIELKMIVDEIGNDIKNINSIVSKKENQECLIDKDHVINNLENIKTFLDGTIGKLKGNII